MRSLLAVSLVLLVLPAGSPAQTCTGLCQQQVTSCPGGGTTSVSGTVYAPNGNDPLPNVIVYVPNAAVAAFTPGVSCPVVGLPPSGSPLVGATSAVDGTFTIPDMPVGTNIPLVIQSGRWRRQITIPSVTACSANPLPASLVVMPQNQTQGDIPKIAIATGSVDAVECVLRKVGIADSEFTDPSGTGRINFFVGDGTATSGGAEIDTATPAETTLMGNISTLNNYDVLMLPCEGGQYIRSSTELANIIAFANAGGRVYSSHFSYVWMYQNPPFNGVVNWDVNQAQLANGLATVNTAFSGGQELSQWLQLVGASTTQGQIAVSTLKHDFNGVVAPTEDWLNLNSDGVVMQMVFDTPVSTGAGVNQCGRVLFNEYHVEAVTGAKGMSFPTECAATGTTMSPQEKLLEYSLFELTNDGGTATLTPATQDFGSQPVGFNSPVQTFTWTNNSTFSAGVTLLTASGDFSVASSNCLSVAAQGSCSINVVFNPTALGARTGTLTVGSSGTTLTAALTGTGIPDLTINSAGLNFGSLDVGASQTQTITVTNSNAGALAVPPLVTTGPYAAADPGCGSILAAGASCVITVTFTPTTTGSLPGTVVFNSSVPAPATPLTGNGVDFTFTASPTTGTVIAGYNSSTVATATPLAGFAGGLTLTCTTSAPGSTCILGSSGFVDTAAVNDNATITTTSQYVVVGYGGFGGSGWLTLLGAVTGLLLFARRRSLGSLTRRGLALAFIALTLGAASLGMSGCSGKLPAKNANYTVPGPYTYTMTATDGFLVHSATYTLTVTAK